VKKLPTEHHGYGISRQDVTFLLSYLITAIKQLHERLISMPILRVFLVMIVWPGGVASAQELLLLTLSQDGHTNSAKSYGTKAPTTLTVLEGNKVILQNSSGKDYRLQASQSGWSWTQVQQVPREMTYIAVTPQLQGTTAQLEVEYSNVDGDNATSYTSTVKGELGEWIPLLQTSGNVQPDRGKRYSTQDGASQLSVRVERAGQ